MDERIKAVEIQVKIQCSNGNWNYSPYMHGMANGMICVLATMKGETHNIFPPLKIGCVIYQR